MSTNYKEIVTKYQKEALDKLIELCSINSTYDSSTSNEDTPYGKGVKDALNYIKNLAIELGFNAINYHNRVVEISYGDGKNLVGIFAHCDVVPPTGEWKYNPFKPTLENSRLYARGTSDDKGPLIASLYALKALKENKLINNYRIKLVVGGDEERGSSCLDYYFNILKKEQPRYGFTPDGDFPLIYAEKGISNYCGEKRINLGPIISIKAGVIPNSVIDKAEVILKKDLDLVSYLKKENIDVLISEENGNLKLIFNGKSAHGSTPELGVNAGLIMMKVLGDYYHINVLSKLAFLYSDISGKNLAYYKTKLVGESTYNLGLINYKDGIFSFICNFRYPENVNINEAIVKINEVSPIMAYVLSSAPCLHFSLKSKLVKTLLKAYQQETNDYESKPLAIGGGTYAKEVYNTIAFGSAFPHSNDHIHEANESISIKDFNDSMSIYARGIHQLGKLK